MASRVYRLSTQNAAFPYLQAFTTADLWRLRRLGFGYLLNLGSRISLLCSQKFGGNTSAISDLVERSIVALMHVLLDSPAFSKRKIRLRVSHNVTWKNGSETRTAIWQSEAGRSAPKKIEVIDDTMTADAAYWRACAGTGMLFEGDFQNAKQLLQAVARRADRKPLNASDTLLQTFHQHRTRQIGQANIANKILIELRDGICHLNRSPDVQEAVERAIGEKPPANLLLSLREVLGMVGANEWRKNGVYIPALDAKVHAYYGVYSPVRGEYMDLVSQASLNSPKVVWDVGTGTGVLSAILVRRGVDGVIATDSNPNAVLCAAENLERLGMQDKVSLVETDLFPDGTADLIVCNPPWVPAKANTPIERAVYDPKSKMLRGFLSGVQQRLNENGEVWLLMSNLAELIGLRGADDLQNWIAEAGLIQLEKLDTSPRHPKASEKSDPLYEARSAEVTSLYRLQAKS